MPEDVEFVTKPEIALAMLKRALAAGVETAWVTGDEVYGGEWGLRSYLAGRGQPYVLAVRSNAMVSPVGEVALERIQAAALVSEIEGSDWKRLSAGEGAKGPRV